jgi:hypothetical protein
MYAHHRRVVETMVDRVRADPDVLALIVVGSVARGDARADSDVDAYLVVTPEALHGRRSRNEVSFDASDLATAQYPEGQAGGTIVDSAFLVEVAARGPEPARFAFTDALLAYSRLPGLEDLLARIPMYPQAERHDKLVGFASQLPVHLAYLRLGEYSDNPYLLAQPAVDLVRAGGRLVLAWNRLLYPGRKWFLRSLERAPDKPAGLLEHAERLLWRPSIEAAEAFCAVVSTFQDWPQPPEGAMARFQRDQEQSWLYSHLPLMER